MDYRKIVCCNFKGVAQEDLMVKKRSSLQTLAILLLLIGYMPIQQFCLQSWSIVSPHLSSSQFRFAEADNSVCQLDKVDTGKGQVFRTVSLGSFCRVSFMLLASHIYTGHEMKRCPYAAVMTLSEGTLEFTGTSVSL